MLQLPSQSFRFSGDWQWGIGARKRRLFIDTFLPTMTTLPSAAQLIVNPSPPSCTVSTQLLLLTSQNLHVPSLETDASSASLTGFHATRSMPPVWPRSSVLFLTCVFSGFQMRSVRSAEPVAMRWPVGFHAMERMLEASPISQGEGVYD